MLTREFIRTYEIRRVQSCLGGLTVAWLAHVFTIDALPLDWIAPFALLYCFMAEMRMRDTYSRVDSDTMSKYRKLFRLDSRYKFALSNPDSPASRVKTILVSHWIILSKEKYIDDDYGMIAHEVTHARRWDSIITFLYVQISQYLIFIALAAPFTFLIFDVMFGVGIIRKIGFGKSILLWIIFSLPALLLYLRRKKHFHIREYLADAEAFRAFPKKYMHRMSELSRRQKFSKDQNTDDNTKHPTFLKRVSYLQGKKHIPKKTILLSLALVALLLPLLSFNAALGYIYVPDSHANPLLYVGSEVPKVEFDRIRFAINSLIQIYTLHLLSVIISVISCGFRSGLSAVEKMLCTLIFLFLSVPGLMIFAVSFAGAKANYGGVGVFSYLAAASLVLSPFIMIFYNFIVTFCFKTTISSMYLIVLSLLSPFLGFICWGLIVEMGVDVEQYRMVCWLGIALLLTSVAALPVIITKKSQIYAGVRFAINPLLRIDPKYVPTDSSP